MAYDFDLLTIGAGSGGVAGTRRAGSYGARTGIIEELRVGGTCVLRGCVPKKLLVYAAHFAEEFEDAAGFGWDVGPRKLDWAKLIETKDRELDRLHGIYMRLLANSNVKVIDGRGVLVDAHTVQVGDKTYTAERIMIATGGWPTLPDIPGKELAITSNEALDLKVLPKRALIVGGGYIAVEFAGIFAGAGVEVTEAIRAPHILRGFDGEVRTHLQEEMTKRGVKFRTGVWPTAVARAGKAFTVTFNDGSTLETDLVMFATGRAPNTKGLGLERAGVKTDAKGAIIVDEWQRTSVPSIYAVGDVTDKLNLTPVAIAEGRGIAETVFNDNPMTMNHENVPTAVFSTPPVGTVGLTEEQATVLHGKVDIYTTRFKPMKHTLSGRDERILMKLVVDPKSDRVLGCHMVGPDSPEIIQGLAIAVKVG
ncbi:MAG: glutathione-disulfide reductase, partial [Alphaproteobacteria bacterium]|nr:glutathione-disulfide reductase [Alphaproteobacteria bacterium]